MARNRRYTQELRKAQAKGYVVVAAFDFYSPDTRSYQVHVQYAPRYATDAQPWVEVRDGKAFDGEGAIRYSGRECTIENRYVVESTLSGHVVMDVIAGAETTPFGGADSYQKAKSYAREANRRHIRKALFGVEITEPF